jgi:hypothetical protein
MWSKIVAVSLIAAGTPIAVAMMGGGCSSTTASFATDCTNYTPDAGNDPNVSCAIGWSCDEATALYQMICVFDEAPEYYVCSCSNGITTTRAIKVDTFICDPQGALSTGNMGCDFNIQQ